MALGRPFQYRVFITTQVWLVVEPNSSIVISWLEDTLVAMGNCWISPLPLLITKVLGFFNAIRSQAIGFGKGHSPLGCSLGAAFLGI